MLDDTKHPFDGVQIGGVLREGDSHETELLASSFYIRCPMYGCIVQDEEQL